MRTQSTEARAGMNLRLFDDAGTGSTGGAAEGAAQALAQDAEAGEAEKPTRGAKDAPADVRQRVDALLGAQEEAEGPEAEPDAENGEAADGENADTDPAEHEKQFQTLMQGEYKKEFNAALQKAAMGVLQQALGKGSDLEAILTQLAGKYGVAGGDIKALRAAIEGGVVKDDAYFEDLAMKKGISTRLAREMDALETENARMKNAEKAAADAAKLQQIQAEWDAAAQRIQAQDPGFVLRDALANPEFGKLLRLGVPMEAAYRAVYFDDIMQRRTEQTAQAVEQGVTDRIRQRGARPAENGTSPGGAAKLKIDPSKLTRAECEELERRARMGQRITF